MQYVVYELDESYSRTQEEAGQVLSTNQSETTK
jgi:hypothetical protein